MEERRFALGEALFFFLRETTDLIYHTRIDTKSQAAPQRRMREIFLSRLVY